MLPIIRVTTVPQKLLNITPAFPVYHTGYPQGVPTSLILFYFSSPSLWRSLHVSQLKRNNTTKQNVEQTFYDTWSSKCNWRLIHTVQLLSRVRLFVTPCTTACQASLSITNSLSPPKPMSIESVMPSSHLILCCPLLLLPSIFPRIRVFSNESALHIRWPKYWSFSFNISPFNEHVGLISFRMDWLDLLSV